MGRDGTASAARRSSTTATMPAVAQPSPGADANRGADVHRGVVRRHSVVCGANPLAFRLVDELVNRYGMAVTVIVPEADEQQGPPIAALPGVRVVSAARLTADAFQEADLATAAALALVAQDDAGNIDAALLAEEMHPGLRIVLRMFNQSLADGVRALLRDCAVLSESAIAAPGFVAAALGDSVPTYLRLAGRQLYVAPREDVAADEVICGLAVAADPDGPEPDEFELLPADERRADLVLTASAAFAPPARPRRRRRRPLRALRVLVGPRLQLVLVVVLGVLAAGTVLIKLIRHEGWWASAYLTILDTVGGANPDLGASGAEQVLQTVLAVLSVALIPIITAAVVEAAVQARLTLAAGGPTEPMRDHVVVVGLGNVGTRVITALHEQGLELVAVDHRPQARGVQVARQLGLPVIVGDATQEGILRAAWVQHCRALVVVSTNDVANLETALLGRALAADLRVVLRLFDGDFADRVERAFGLTISRSVSYLAAPTFAAAMTGREVLDTIAVRRRVLLVAELPVGAGSALENRPVRLLHRPHEARLLAVRTGRGAQTLWAPPPGRKLVRTDRILVVATRLGLSRLLAETAASGLPVPPVGPDGPVAGTHAVQLPVQYHRPDGSGGPSPGGPVTS
jgi:Trk K+ transport system NAD-binding subunit